MQDAKGFTRSLRRCGPAQIVTIPLRRRRDVYLVMFLLIPGDVCHRHAVFRFHGSANLGVMQAIFHLPPATRQIVQLRWHSVSGSRLVTPFCIAAMPYRVSQGRSLPCFERGPTMGFRQFASILTGRRTFWPPCVERGRPLAAACGGIWRG